MNNKRRSEIDVVRELIDQVKELPCRQCFSLDALHTQTKTVGKIISVNHDYLIAVKENQPTLLRRIEQIARNHQPLTQALREEHSHGRRVQRKVSVFEAPQSLRRKWMGLKTLILVERQGHRGSKDFHQSAYYLSSQSLSAPIFMQKIQGHWSIENQLHWVKDVTFAEDEPPRRGGHAPVNWAILFSWFITLARRAKFRTVPDACRFWANQVDEVFSLLS